MKNENELTKESSKYSFFITYKPINVKFISRDQVDLITEHYRIISALRNTLMSVKDIHKLFKDQKTGKYSYTLKTIYRHLEKLENAGLVTAAGYREKKSTRSCERVYCRTAKIFFLKFDEEELKLLESEKGEQYAQVLSIALSELLQTSEPDKSDFYNLFKRFSVIKADTLKELYEKTGKNSELADFLGQIEVNKLNSILDLASIIKVFLQHPDLLNQIQSLLKTKDPEKK